MRKKITVFDIVVTTFLMLVSLLCILPFVNLLAISFSSSSAVAAGHIGFFPVDFTLDSYEFVIKGGKFWRAMLISVERVILGTSLNLIVMVLTAYPLSKEKGKLTGRGFYVTFYVITMLFNGGMIPTYILVSRLGLKDTIWALVLPGVLPIGNMIILMNFMRGLPNEMEEAAQVDGASPLQILVRVMLPVLKPALATVGLFSMVGHWNEWFSGMIYMNYTENYPLQTYLQSLLKSFDQLLLEDKSANIQELLARINLRTGRAAQLFLAALPIMLVYPFMQKYFTKGLVIGSVKG